MELAKIMKASIKREVRKSLEAHGILVKKEHSYEVASMRTAITRLWVLREHAVQAREIVAADYRRFGWPVVFDRRVDWYLDERANWPLASGFPAGADRSSGALGEDGSQALDRWFEDQALELRKDQPKLFSSSLMAGKPPDYNSPGPLESTTRPESSTVNNAHVEPCYRDDQGLISIGLFPVESPGDLGNLLPSFAAGDSPGFPFPAWLHRELWRRWYQRDCIALTGLSPKFLEVTFLKPFASLIAQRKAAFELVVFAPDALSCGFQVKGSSFRTVAELETALSSLKTWILFWD